MKKLVSIILALALLLSMALPALAKDESPSKQEENTGKEVGTIFEATIESSLGDTKDTKSASTLAGGHWWVAAVIAVFAAAIVAVLIIVKKKKWGRKP